MKKIIQSFLLVLFAFQLQAQNFTGQWKGEFIDKSTSFSGWGGDRCEYVLELECVGTKVNGYSYTYFSDGGKRYYTICKLSGTLNRAGKYVEIKETERTKTNVPVSIRNCFQIHKLTYFQEGDRQTLEGSWVPVPNQEGDCGYGTTVLSRRVLQKNPAYLNDVTKAKPRVNPPVVKNTSPRVTPPGVKTTPPVVRSTPKKTVPVKKNPPAIAKATPEKKTVPENGSIEKKTDVAQQSPAPPPVRTEPANKKIMDTRYEKRNSDVIKTIEIDNETFTVDLYDNGDIDGDSVTLFFNGQLLLSHKRLSDKALRLKLNVDEDRAINELIMYAENLGSIPPNTALMVVNDGDNRYEVRISSDLQKSGVIRFVHKPKIRQ